MNAIFKDYISWNFWLAPLPVYWPCLWLTLFFSSSCVCNCLTSALNKPLDDLLESLNWDDRSYQTKKKTTKLTQRHTNMNVRWTVHVCILFSAASNISDLIDHAVLGFRIMFSWVWVAYIFVVALNLFGAVFWCWGLLRSGQLGLTCM